MCFISIVHLYNIFLKIEKIFFLKIYTLILKKQLTKSKFVLCFSMKEKKFSKYYCFEKKLENCIIVRIIVLY